MVKWSSVALIALSIVHLLVLGADVPAELGRWLGLNLWTFDHWAPMRAQEVDLALSNGIFWSTVGSFAIPQLILGVLLLWMDRRGVPIPGFVGWALVAWAVLCTVLMPPSGFPVAVLVALFLAIGLARRSAFAR